MIEVYGTGIISNGTMHVYTDILLLGDATLKTRKCIEIYNDSAIIIDLSSRLEDEVVLMFDCKDVPIFNIEFVGYKDGCIPRYSIDKTSLKLIFDTASCNSEEESIILPVVIVITIVCMSIMIGIVLIVVFGNNYIYEKIFNSKGKEENVSDNTMMHLENTMKGVDTQLHEVIGGMVKDETAVYV